MAVSMVAETAGVVVEMVQLVQGCPILRSSWLESYSYRERWCPNCSTLLETDLLIESET